jgi:predicted nucleic acid-binding protein
VIAAGEILQGVDRLPMGLKREALQDQVQTVLPTVSCEPVPVSAAAIYARIKTQRQGVSRSMDANDLWIAATAVSLGAILVSCDPDFTDVPGLQVEDWTK